jgi:hypothetical protein
METFESPRSAEINNKWIYTSTFPLRLYGLHRNSLRCNLMNQSFDTYFDQ